MLYKVQIRFIIIKLQKKMINNLMLTKNKIKINKNINNNKKQSNKM
jgi:hypothetical protein